MAKVQETDYSQNWKILTMKFSKKLKTKNYPKTTKSQKLQKKLKKSHVRRPQVKKFRKQTIVSIEKYEELYFQKFQKLKITPKTHKNKNFKTLKSNLRRPQIKKVQKINYSKIKKS